MITQFQGYIKDIFKSPQFSDEIESVTTLSARNSLSPDSGNPPHPLYNRYTHTQILHQNLG